MCATHVQSARQLYNVRVTMLLWNRRMLHDAIGCQFYNGPQHAGDAERGRRCCEPLIHRIRLILHHLLGTSGVVARRRDESGLGATMGVSATLD